MNTRVLFVLFNLSLWIWTGTAQVRTLDQVQEVPRFRSLGEWLGRAEELRQRIWMSSGLWPMPERRPLTPLLSEPIPGEGYLVRNVVLETLPGFYLTGNLFEPTGPTGPLPAVLSAHGHWRAGRLENSETASVPGRAINLARQGYVVFNYSMIGYDENRDLFPHSFDEPGYQLWGWSAAGLQMWNSLRALDFLVSLPHVDRERIGMTGASGGGTQTYMLAAVDPRIKVAAPVNMISAHFQGGCICENPPLLRLDSHNVELGALTAPRPLLMVSTRGDWTAATPHLEFPAIQNLYRLFGRPERVANVHLPYPHNYNRESREAVYQWFAQWLLRRNEPIPEQPFELDVEPLRARLPSPPAPLEEVFRRFREGAERQIRDAEPEDWPTLLRYREVFGPALQMALEPGRHPPERVTSTLFPAERRGRSRAVLIVFPPEAVWRQQAARLAEGYRDRDWMVFLLESRQRQPEGMGAVRYWTTYNPSAASIQINEIRSAAEEVLSRPDTSSLDLIGLGRAGWPSLLARALVPGIRNTSIDGDGVAPEEDDYFLEQLFVPLLRRAGDFQTAAAAIVPGHLKIVRMPEGRLKKWITHLYQKAGAGPMLAFAESPAAFEPTQERGSIDGPQQ